jgi:hypothetical protein
MCDKGLIYARHPMTGDCCAYDLPCQAPAGWKQYMSIDDCTKAP